MTRTLTLFGLIAAFALAVPVVPLSPLSADPALARHGADDPAGDDRGGKGGDDGIGHTELSTMPVLLLARHGADDPAGDDHGRKRRGGKGGGGHDDGPNHG
jgi:hypothetical protein